MNIKEFQPNTKSTTDKGYMSLNKDGAEIFRTTSVQLHNLPKYFFFIGHKGKSTHVALSAPIQHQDGMYHVDYKANENEEGNLNWSICTADDAEILFVETGSMEIELSEKQHRVVGKYKISLYDNTELSGNFDLIQSSTI